MKYYQLGICAAFLIYTDVKLQIVYFLTKMKDGTLMNRWESSGFSIFHERLEYFQVLQVPD